jgi:hypothetical protein
VAPAVLLDLIATRLSMSRRATARVRCIAHVATLRNDGRAEGVVENVSLGGFLMQSPDGFAIGERFGVEFCLPEEGGRVVGDGRAVRVLRSNPESPHVRVGVAFERLDDDSPEALRKFVESHMSDEMLSRVGEPPVAFRPSLASILKLAEG